MVFVCNLGQMTKKWFSIVYFLQTFTKIIVKLKKTYKYNRTFMSGF
jgi:hypothetical protein